MHSQPMKLKIGETNTFTTLSKSSYQSSLLAAALLMRRRLVLLNTALLLIFTVVGHSDPRGHAMPTDKISGYVRCAFYNS